MIECGNCGEPFEPVRTRWLCPRCKYKESCCEGEPLAVAES
jgi:Zn finger protein HypA/HybF involved in hydrogenase expression